MPDAKVTKSGNAPIVKVGHTTGSKYGTDPLKKERGPSNPAPINYGSKG